MYWRKDEHRWLCRVKRRVARRVYYEANRERERQRSKEQRLANIDEYRERQAQRERVRREDHLYRERQAQRERDRYDNDPIYRIEKNLKTGARRRAATLKRKREALHGEISPEG